MKLLRVLLLLLLTVLIPARGALAATMLCGSVAERAGMLALVGNEYEHEHEHEHAGHGEPVAHQAGEHGHHPADAQGEHHGEHHGVHHGGHAAEPGPVADDDGDQRMSSANCQICASGCQVTPLAAAPVVLAEAQLSAALVFPALSAAIGSFEPEGLERPPRTL